MLELGKGFAFLGNQYHLNVGGDDFYIDLLDSHSANILKAYYDDDLSLAEIAAGEGISRQGIRHIIKKSEEQLLFYEEKLGLAKRYSELEEAAERLNGL